MGALPTSISLKRRGGPAHMPFTAEHVRELLALLCFASQSAEAVTRLPFSEAYWSLPEGLDVTGLAETPANTT